MARGKDSHWKPKSIFLVPDTYHNGDSYPGKEQQSALENDGYGSCSIQGGFDRSWTIDLLANEVTRHFPHHKGELDKTGVDFAKITQGSKKIAVHAVVKTDTVADLEKHHGKGILVILQKSGNGLPKVPKAESRSSPHVLSEKESARKLQGPTRIKSEPKSPIGPTDQVQLELDALAKSGDIKIAHLNCQSLCNKKDELQLLLLCRTDIDVMSLSETWLRPEDRNDSFSVPGYTILARKDGVPKDSGRPRGGVLTYVKESLAKSAREVILNEDLEAVCVDIELEAPAKRETLDKEGRNGIGKGLKSETESGACAKRALLRILNVYVSPGTREQIKQFQKLQRSMDTLRAGDKCRKSTTSRGFVGQTHSCTCKTNYVILGDLNCDRNNLGECKIMESVKGEKIQTLDKLESSHQLTQLVKDFTRVDLRKDRGRDTYHTTKAVIDVIYTDNPANVTSGVVHVAMSDHYMVYCAWGHGMKKRVQKATSLPTQDVAFRHFSSRVQSDIDQDVFDLIRKRDSAHARENWEEYERLKDNIKKAKNKNRKERKQYEKEKEKLKQEKVAV